jgi:glyoxylase-like metal-dependent hydrolase (beta-lactamase superfamily II)
VLADALVGSLADKFATALKAISARPVRFVINTHYHGDHTSGHEVLARRGATVVAHRNVRSRLERGGVGGNFGSFRFEYAAAPKLGLPSLVFDDSLTLHLNGEEVRIQHMAASHTDGDSIVFFRKSNVVHPGDEFVTYGFPEIEIVSGGSVSGNIAVLERLLRELPADVKVIPGHGPVSTLADVRRFATMLKETQAAVKQGIARGLNLEQLQGEEVLKPWDSWAGFFSAAVFTEFLYNDLQGVRRWPEPVEHPHADGSTKAPRP